MTCLQRSIRIAEVFADLVRGGRPRPEIRITHETGTHRIGGDWIELQLPHINQDSQLYDITVAMLIEAFYQLPFGTLGLKDDTTQVG
jgi:hypothetical protein